MISETKPFPAKQCNALPLSGAPSSHRRASRRVLAKLTCLSLFSAWISTSAATAQTAPQAAAQAPAAPTNPSNSADVTAAVVASIKGNALSVVANNALAGSDPARKQRKRLIVIYSFGAQDMTAEVPEGQTLTLTAPAGKTLTVRKATYGALASTLPAPSTPPQAAGAGTATPPKAPAKETIFLPRPVPQITLVAPARFEKRGAVFFADFSKDAFGNLQLTLPATVPAATTLTVRLGEKLAEDGSIDRKPPGSIAYRQVTLTTQANQSVYQLQLPSKGGVQPAPEIGNIAPFRYAEIEGSPVDLPASALRQMFAHTAFNENASSFQSSDATLNAVWELCKHTMEATTALGVYIDGERERKPYEADAYINFRSHLASDFNPEVGRYSIEYLLEHPTWPTEWSFHMPMMAQAEYEETGDTALIARDYEALKPKLLMDKARPDGLLVAKPIVDWPGGERDGYDTKPDVNMAVNAFYYHALQQMATIARALNKSDDAQTFDAKAKVVYAAINSKFFDPATGLYLDGEGSTHSSLHANMFALAFDLVPAERMQKVADFVQSRGMACSVYGAQYLLEALYKSGKDDYALQLMTSHDQRSWWNMIQVGSTMTMEAWDLKFKGNSTWNHSWGAAPANIISRYLVGVQPLTPGYGKILIAPRPGTLQTFDAKVPTAKGPVTVKVQNAAQLTVQIEVPQGATAQVSLPLKSAAAQLTMDSRKVAFTRQGNALVVDNVAPGRHTFVVL